MTNTTTGKPATLYHSLSWEQRRAAVEVLLRTTPEFRNSVIRRFVLGVGGFRPETLRSWPLERLAREVVRRDLEAPCDDRFLLRIHYTETEPTIQEAFLEAAGVAHLGATISADSQEPFTDAETVEAASLVLVNRFGSAGIHYLACLHEYAADLWPGIAEAVEAARTALAASTDIARSEPTAEPGAEPEDTNDLAEAAEELATIRLAPPGKGELHVLDDVVTVSLINSANGVDGAIPPEAARRLVAELVRVNGQRHQSWHAAGLYRALVGDDGIQPGPGESEGARRWFLAGWVVGLMRRDEVNAVVELYDSDPLCRSLGNDGLGPSEEAAPFIFTALWRAERFANAVAFLTPMAIANSAKIRRLVLDRATGLLALRDWENARPAFDLLWAGLQHLSHLGLDRFAHLRLDIERRQAHCRRLAGDFQAAATILQPLVDDEENAPEMRGMMLVDLALMDAGFHELAEVRLPSDRNDASSMARRLDGVEDRLEQAVQLDPDRAAHARYLLGFRALLREHGQAALRELEHAVSAFRARPQIYDRQGLLDQAELHEAIAICLEAGRGPDRIRAAAERLTLSTAEELRIPDWLLEPVLTGVAMADVPAAMRMAERLLETRGTEVVQTLMPLAGELRPVAVAVARLIAEGARSPGWRVDAARQVIPALLRHEELDLADALLAMVLEQAMRGVGRDDVLALLADRDPLLMIRDPEDLLLAEAEVRLAGGDTNGAVGLLNQLAEQALARREQWDRAEGAAIIERLEEIQEADDISRSLRERLNRVEARLEGPLAPRVPEPIRLLVVGGNEVQARYESAIHEILRTEAPHLTVEFLHSGWDSNWGALAEEVTRRLQHADGLVLHYFMRTMFGRRVRKATGDKPWRSVGGHGRDGILRGIYATAEAVVGRKRKQLASTHSNVAT